MPLADEETLDRWAEANATPFVLKADGSWAGFGVRIISDAAAAKDAYRPDDSAGYRTFGAAGDAT